MALMKPQLPDDFDNFVIAHSGKPPMDALKTFCRWMMFHEQWKCMLNDDFMEAYVHRIIIDCLDAIVRRFYPQIFIYSSDYPEKCVSKFILAI